MRGIFIVNLRNGIGSEGPYSSMLGSDAYRGKNIRNFLILDTDCFQGFLERELEEGHASVLELCEGTADSWKKELEGSMLQFNQIV